MERPIYLFTFVHGHNSWEVMKLPDGRYRFVGVNGSHNVVSWKRECFRLSEGKVNYA